MPHIVLETSSDLAENSHLPEILGALVHKLSQFDTIESKAIKARHTLKPVWVMGEGAPPGFAHCTVSLLDGRPIELKQKIMNGLFEELKTQMSFSLGAELVALSLEVREMDRQTYIKL